MNAQSFSHDLSRWDVSNVTNMNNMFSGTTSFNEQLCWDVSASTGSIFQNSNGSISPYPDCIRLDDITIRQAVKKYNAGDYSVGPISEWDTSLVTNMEGLFYRSDTFNGDISKWDVSNVSTMKDMLYFAPSFNCDLSEWDVSKVSNMTGMFGGAWSFNGELPEWNVSKVTTMDYMFMNAQSFNSDISKWDVSEVNNMESMLGSAVSFNGDISQWDVSEVTNMEGMFMYAHSFDDDLNKWDVTNVLFMDYMFYGAISFNQELCWDTSASVAGMFDGSPGTLSQYPDCTYYQPTNTLSPTQTPSKRKYDHTSSTLTPTQTPARISDRTPTLIPTTPPTDIVIPEPTITPTSIATSEPTHTPVTPTASPESASIPLADSPGPFYIISGLSTDSQKWCMYAANNYVHSGTIIAIDRCQTWNSFKWTMDYEGKIINYKDPSFCIQMTGERMTIEKCINGSGKQMWFYNSNGKRILSLINGLNGMAVANGVASKKAQVKKLLYGDGSVTDAETWEISYDSTGTLYVPNYNTFRIISQLSTTDTQWCLYPANNSPVNGMKIAISICKTWKTYLWMMDLRGKLINVKNPTKCITYSGKRMQIADCGDGDITQRFAYSVINKKLVTLRNGRREATVTSGNAYANSQVQLSYSEIPTQKYQTWILEQF